MKEHLLNDLSAVVLGTLLGTLVYSIPVIMGMVFVLMTSGLLILWALSRAADHFMGISHE